MKLRDINALTREITEDHERRKTEYLASMRRRLLADIAAVERNRQVLPYLFELLGEEAVSVPQYANETEVLIDLGLRPTTKRGLTEFRSRLVGLRQLLGPLTKEGEYPTNGKKKLVKVSLAPKEYPGIQIIYLTKLPKGAKCQIRRVKHKAYTTYEMVCDV